MLPDEWAPTRLGRHFQSSRTKGTNSLPTLSVTLNDGLVRRDSLDRKMDTSLAENEHLLVKAGDIAYNMMRMWQGASGLATEDGLVSPAYVVLRSDGTIDPLFAAYLFKSPRLIYLFWAYSYGITEDRLRLYFDDFSAIPLNLPPLPEQRRVAEILATWDAAIEMVEAQIANARTQKKALMQSLLTGKKRLPGFGGNWSQVSLGERGAFRKGRGISKSEVRAHGLPCVRYGEIYTRHHDIIGAFYSFIDEASAAQAERINFGDLLFTCSGETAEEIGKCVAFVTAQEAYAGSDIIIFSPVNDNSVFLAYLLNSPPLALQKAQFGQGNSVVHISGTNLAKLKFRLPTRAEQDAIAEVLLVVDREVAALVSKSSALRQEKSALMQQLLTGKRRVNLNKKDAA